jgi:hypothetical protein
MKEKTSKTSGGTTTTDDDDSAIGGATPASPRTSVASPGGASGAKAKGKATTAGVR